MSLSKSNASTLRQPTHDQNNSKTKAVYGSVGYRYRIGVRYDIDKQKTSRYARVRCLIYTPKQLSFSTRIVNAWMPGDGGAKHVRHCSMYRNWDISIYRNLDVSYLIYRNLDISYVDISKLRYFDISKLSIRYRPIFNRTRILCCMLLYVVYCCTLVLVLLL